MLTWTGDLSAGDTATITYSVTVNNPETGGTILTNTVASAAVRQQLPGRQPATPSAPSPSASSPARCP